MVGKRDREEHTDLLSPLRKSVADKMPDKAHKALTVCVCVRLRMCHHSSVWPILSCVN